MIFVHVHLYILAQTINLLGLAVALVFLEEVGLAVALLVLAVVLV